MNNMRVFKRVFMIAAIVFAAVTVFMPLLYAAGVNVYMVFPLMAPERLSALFFICFPVMALLCLLVALAAGRALNACSIFIRLPSGGISEKKKNVRKSDIYDIVQALDRKEHGIKLTHKKTEITADGNTLSMRMISNVSLETADKFKTLLSDALLLSMNAVIPEYVITGYGIEYRFTVLDDSQKHINERI
ncbi:MAG: hypothetical protein FWE62_00570, partial [Firmicutes bacterium]|nr:hypothetical protein [Bacillota bacterium]